MGSKLLTGAKKKINQKAQSKKRLAVVVSVSADQQIDLDLTSTSRKSTKTMLFICVLCKLSENGDFPRKLCRVYFLKLCPLPLIIFALSISIDFFSRKFASYSRKIIENLQFAVHIEILPENTFFALPPPTLYL